MEDQEDAVSGEADQFPVGLRVLVVDDEPCCLKVVEAILRKCKYNVTATSKPLEALEMLREDKNRFEIVITDVNMPGIDGFKLLQLIGIEMDLPVIMLSADGDTKLVMKGVQHGACDYLVKPCRMAELKNIWHHVYRRKHMSQKLNNSNNSNTSNSQNQDDEQGLALPENPENFDSSKEGRKRKDPNEGEEEENGESETEDPAMTQKKPRVVWSSQLHEKFVAAVTHLTIEKAVPKKILDWMNVDGLTRENVASHLQKYRLFLKRIEAAKNKQENSMHTRSTDGFGLPGSQRFSTNSFSSTGVLGRFNSPSRLSMNPIVRTGLIQQSTSQNMNNNFSSFGKFVQSQSPELCHGNPALLEVDPMNNLSGFSYPTSFSKSGVGLTMPMNSGLRMPANHLLFQGNQHVLGSGLVKSECFDIGTDVSSDLLGHDLSKRDWEQGVQLSQFPSTSFGSFETLNHHEIHSNNSSISHVQSPIDLPLTNAAQNPQPDFQVNVGGQDDLITNVFSKEEEHIAVFGHNPSDSGMNSLSLADEIMGQNGLQSLENCEVSHLIGQSNDIMVPFEQHNAVDQLLGEPSMDFNSNFLNMAQNEFLQGDFDLVDDDIVNVITIPEPNNGTTLMDEVFWN